MSRQQKPSQPEKTGEPSYEMLHSALCEIDYCRSSREGDAAYLEAEAAYEERRQKLLADPGLKRLERAKDAAYRAAQAKRAKFQKRVSVARQQLYALGATPAVRAEIAKLVEESAKT